MVECQLPKLDVAGSSPVSRSIFSITCTPRQISSFLICLNKPRIIQILRLGNLTKAPLPPPASG